MKQRVTDISIAQTGPGWRLHIPIATGHLEITLEVGKDLELDRFLQTALLTPSRRFGEHPSRNGE